MERVNGNNCNRTEAIIREGKEEENDREEREDA
jgi:hypothetical protein